jgi:hypothetical protein
MLKLVLLKLIYMKKLTTFLLIIISASVKAQSLSPQVIASAGDYFSNGNVSLSWTLGEPVIETYTTANIILTQGFQQPELLTVGINDVLKSDFSSTIYPNPTFNIISVQLNNQKNAQFTVEIINGLGQVIQSLNFDAVKNKQNNFQLNLTDLSVGMYQIRLSEKGQVFRTYNIQKLHY